ncbi:hypothetical protein WS46_00460 [Burkholderia sp. RF4-BP95]|nr:hypothetical protein WS46_00460 [Burkholderia sp. RF4-BP95]
MTRGAHAPRHGVRDGRCAVLAWRAKSAACGAACPKVNAYRSAGPRDAQTRGDAARGRGA